MYNVIEQLKDINLIRVMNINNPQEVFEEIPLFLSTFLLWGNDEWKISINHRKGELFNYKKGGYENGILKFGDSQLMILQDYGDYSYKPPKGYIELDERLIYINEYERSLGFFEGKICLLLPHENILDILLISKLETPEFKDIDSKRSYNAKFLIREGKNTENDKFFLEREVLFYVQFAGQKHFIPLGITYSDLINPLRINEIILQSLQSYEPDEDLVEYKERAKANGGYVGVLYFIHRGFSYNAEENYFQRGDLKIYEDGMAYFSLTPDCEELIWYQNDVEELIKSQTDYE